MFKVKVSVLNSKLLSKLRIMSTLNLELLHNIFDVVVSLFRYKVQDHSVHW